MAKQTIGPRARIPHPTSGTQIPLKINDYQVSFDRQAFNHLINSQGIRVCHHRAIPDPTGMLSRGDGRSSGVTKKSVDGFIYKEAGVVTASFSSNSQSMNASPEFTIAHATAYMTFPDVYDSSKVPLLISNWDRFYLKDIELRVVTWQYLEANSIGIDRLHFPATCVEHLIDANGNEYEEGKDFTIDSMGRICWVGQYRPGWNAQLGKGTVYAVRYRYTPFFIVNRLLHEIRVSQITDAMTHKRSLERMPYQVEVVREHVFLDTNRDEHSDNNEDPRYQNMPDPGGALS